MQGSIEHWTARNKWRLASLDPVHHKINSRSGTTFNIEDNTSLSQLGSLALQQL